VIIDVMCGMAVMRGANIFTAGILKMPPGWLCAVLTDYVLGRAVCRPVRTACIDTCRTYNHEHDVRLSVTFSVKKCGNQHVIG